MDLLSAGRLFTPPINHRRKKKKKDSDKDPSKLSMKSRTPSQFTQRQMNPPSQASNPVSSSDEDVVPLGQRQLQYGDMGDLMTDDESDNKAKSTATSKTSASYMTCVTNLAHIDINYEPEISEDEDDHEITVLQQFSTQKITYEISEDDDDDVVHEKTVVPSSAAPSTPKFEVNSEDKVKHWLKNQKIPKPASPSKAAKKLDMVVPAEPLTGSQASSSGYPTTTTTGRSRFSSLGATSRQESSPEFLNNSHSPPDPISQNSSNSSQPLQERNGQNGSFVNSQTTSSSRSSSFYFKERPPWSQVSQEQRQPPRRRKPAPPKYSAGSSIWSDAKSTQEESSLRLYIETSDEVPKSQEEVMLQDFRKQMNHKPIMNEENEDPAKNRSRSKTPARSEVFSGAETVAPSEPCSSSEELDPGVVKQILDLTHSFNPVHSSTHRSSTLSFPSYTSQQQKYLNDTLQKTPEKAANNNRMIEISSDEENHFETEVPESDGSEEEPERILQRPTRASFIELLSSDSEAEPEPERRKRNIPETDSEEEEEDVDTQKTYFSEGQVSEDEEQVPKSSGEASLAKIPEEDDFIAKPSPHRAKASIISPVRRPRYISSDSEDDFDKMDQFFRRQKEKKEIIETEVLKKSTSQDNSFVVDDDVIELDSDVDSDDDVEFSPSFYLKVINDRRRAEQHEIDVSIQAGNVFEIRKQFTQTPVKTPKRLEARTENRTPAKPRARERSPHLSFLRSLSSDNHEKCDPKAIPYLKKFNAKKDDLVDHLYSLFNETVFDGKLDKDMSITWNNRLTSTAGFCYNQRKKVSEETTIKISRIELSGKILTNAASLRDTLIHELCHAATWVIDETLGGHGPVWKKWTRKAQRVHPELPEIRRCHSYKVDTKFTYKCTKCYYSFGRHSKSLDMDRKVCGICKGRFELIVNSKKGASATPKKPNVFALFVQENYKIVKQKDMVHKDVMQALSQKFKEAKLQNA